MLDGTNSFSLDWSWDTRHVLVKDYLPNGEVHLMIVDVADGHHRELVHLQSGDIDHAVFSPDGHNIAYETWQNDTGSSDAMRIFVMPAEGAQPQQVYQSPWRAPGGVARAKGAPRLDRRRPLSCDLRRSFREECVVPASAQEWGGVWESSIRPRRGR